MPYNHGTRQAHALLTLHMHSLDTTTGYTRWIGLLLVLSALLAGCSTRQVQDSLVGSTAQRLVTHAIDDLISQLPADDFEPLRGQTLYVHSHFIEHDGIRQYADQRLVVELQSRFGIQTVAEPNQAVHQLVVFYTSLGTDQTVQGFYLPLGFVPGFDQASRVNLISLEQFHGVAEMYYFLGPPDGQQRSPIIQARTRTDALGLPIITIPLSNIDR